MTIEPTVSERSGHKEQARTWHVESRDGTKIGCFSIGDGPPLVLVHGILSDHTRWAPILPYVDDFTVHAIDRRGRGASGDHAKYDVEREIEDIVAVVDTVSDLTNSPVDLYGHSTGGALALAAAAETENVRKIIVYEPAISGAALFPAGLLDRLEALLQEDDREGVVETFCREALRFDDEQMAAFRDQPSWSARVAAAHTLPREIRIPPDRLFSPAKVSLIDEDVWTLILQGSESPEGFKRDVQTVAIALRNVHVNVLEGLGHSGDILSPEIVGRPIDLFLQWDQVEESDNPY